MTLSPMGFIAIAAASFAALLVLKSIRVFAAALIINVAAQVAASALLRGDWKLPATLAQLSLPFAWGHLTFADEIAVLVGGLAALGLFRRFR
jgi:hypothetical protein